MALHLRDQIMDALATLLTGLTTTGSRVYVDRDADSEPLSAAELPGILNWLLDGFREWREKGLRVPDEVAAATETYRSESDPVGEFMRSCTAAAPGQRVKAKTLYEAYAAWAKANSVEPVSTTLFGRRLGDMGYRKETVGVVYYVGLEIVAAALDGLGVDPADPAASPPPPLGEDDYGR